jgi:hypothetical protein
MDVVGEQWCMSEQAFAEMSKVSVRIACRCRPLVHLNDMYILPGELFVGARSISHGVRPPLTAMMKRPREGTAARASTAMIAAALRAIKSSSKCTSICRRWPIVGTHLSALPWEDID